MRVVVGIAEFLLLIYRACWTGLLTIGGPNNGIYMIRQKFGFGSAHIWYLLLLGGDVVMIKGVRWSFPYVACRYSSIHVAMFWHQLRTPFPAKFCCTCVCWVLQASKMLMCSRGNADYETHIIHWAVIGGVLFLLLRDSRIHICRDRRRGRIRRFFAVNSRRCDAPTVVFHFKDFDVVFWNACASFCPGSKFRL